MHLPNGTLLQGGRYEIIRYISSGGFGCTYEARDTKFKSRVKSVAIKEFFVKDFCCRDTEINNTVIATRGKVELVDKLRANFLDEANVLFEFEHPNIVRVTDVFEENGTAYYVMDYITGCTLSEIIENKGLLIEDEALGYIRQVADALKYVHANNRAHLDVKPQNIMVYDDGRAVLIDFGVSKQYDEVNGENSSALVGFTPGYAPIEQSGHARVKLDAASDIYALGATLYKLLTGTTPLAAAVRASDNAFKELSFIPTVSSAMRNAIDKAMQISRNDRPQNIDEFLCLLESKTGVAKVKSKKILPIIFLLLFVFVVVGCFFLFSDGSFSAIKENETSAEDNVANKNITTNYMNIKYSDADLIPLLDENGKFGFVDKEGNDVIPCKYDDVNKFLNGLAKVRIGDKDNGKWGFIDMAGKEIVPCKYDYVYSNSEGFVRVRIGDKDNGKWGVIDKTGKEIVSCKYDDMGHFSDGLAKVRIGDKDNGKWGFIDMAGKKIVPCKYDDVDSSDKGFVRVRIGDKDNGKWGVIDKTGKEIVPCKYRFVSNYFEGLCLVFDGDDEANGKYGFIDEKGNIVIPCIYNSAGNFNEGLAEFGMYTGNDYECKYGFINKAGKEIVPCKYDYVNSFSDGFAIVEVGEYKNRKMGLIDQAGNEVVPCKYDEIDSFEEDMCSVKRDGKWGFINKVGKEIVPCKYDAVECFSDGLACVRIGDKDNGKWGVVDKVGRVVFTCKFDDVSSFSDGLARVKKDGKEYYIDKNGKEYIKKSMYK